MRIGGNLGSLRSFVNANSGKVQKRWQGHNARGFDALTDADLRHALRWGDLPDEAYARIADEDTRFVRRELQAAWISGIKQGGQSATAGIRRASKAWAGAWEYVPTGKYVDDWIRRRTGALITQWGRARQGALRQIISHAIRGYPLRTGEQPSAYYIGEAIKAAFGLTEYQAGWVTSFNDKLYQALLTDPKTSGLSPSKLNAIVEKKTRLYEYSMTQMRAQTIARTETAAAFNAGQQAAVSEAASEQMFGQGVKVFKVWSAASDCCDLCQELDGTKVGIDEGFGAHGAGGADGDPPLHPNCRCTVFYETE